MNMVPKDGLRRGDAVTGAVEVPRRWRRQQRPEQPAEVQPAGPRTASAAAPLGLARNRPEFGKLTPLYPNQRLRLETTTRS